MAAADAHRAAGSTEEARARYDRATTIYRSLGWRDEESNALSGAIATSPEGSDAALTRLRRLLALNFESTDQPRFTSTLENIGDVYLENGAPDDAVRLYLQAYDLNSGARTDLSSLRAKLADAYRSLGDTTAAVKFDDGRSAAAFLHPKGPTPVPTPVADSGSGTTGSADGYVDLRPFLQQANQAHADGNPRA